MPSARPGKFEQTDEPVIETPQPVSLAATLSPLQQDIENWFAHRRPDSKRNACVRARAGAGKTFTIVRGVLAAPEDSVLVTTHTRRMMEELRGRFEAHGDERVFAKGLHAVGRRSIVRHRKYPAWNCERFEREDALAAAVSGALPFGAKRLISKLVTLARELQPVTATAESLYALAQEYDIWPDNTMRVNMHDVAHATVLAMDIAANDVPLLRKTGMDFADMLFLPLRNSLLDQEFALGVIDEAQDATMTQLMIFEAVVGGRMCIVGDDRQAIFGFRGADSNALDRLKTELDAIEFPLNETYRCPTSVVAIANTIVPDLVALPTAPEGVIDTVQTLDEVCEQAEAGNFVVSRTNAPLAKVAMRLLRQHKRVFIQGKDIGRELRALVRKLAGKGVGRFGRAETNSIVAFVERVAEWRDKEVARFNALEREDKAERARDIASTLVVLSEDKNDVQALIDTIDHLFSDEGTNAVICTTVHKAKGLEADRVFILRPTFYLPLPCECGHRQHDHAHRVGVCRKCTPRCATYRADQAARREEDNIFYVAVTRAKQHLTWCEER